jgi:hypothetical protein
LGKCIPEGKQIANKDSDWHGHARGLPRVRWAFKKTPGTFLSLTGDDKEERVDKIQSNWSGLFDIGREKKKWETQISSW